MSKCIYFPPSTEEANKEFIKDKEEFLSRNDSLILDMNKLQFYDNWEHNELHITTESHYTYILPEMGKFLGFNYDINDFELIEKKDRTGNFDISYLFPKKNKKFKIAFQDKQYMCGYEGMIGFNNAEKCEKDFFDNTSFKEMNPDYHLLFFASHQCCVIENLDENNGKTVVISGDSQLIPDVPILAYYYKKIVYLDKRRADYGSVLFNISRKDEVVYVMSKYDLAKYTDINSKKCRFID